MEVLKDSATENITSDNKRMRGPNKANEEKLRIYLSKIQANEDSEPK